MRFSLFVCLIGVFLLGVRADVDLDDGGIDEDVSIEDTPSATLAPTFEKGNVPVIKSTSSNIFFEEQFQDQSKWSRWVKSQARKEGVEESLAKYDGEWGFEIPQSSVYKDEYGLILKSKAKHHAITAPLNRPFDFSVSPLVVQYEVKYQTNQECGGAYVKLLSSESRHLDLKQVTDKTPYTIMFGPDMCGVEHKYHFIIRYRHPKTGVYTEHQAKKPTEPLDSYFTDKKTHLYTLVLSADNSFKVYIDNKLINSGNLLEDMEPSITPQKEIVDETDRKPEDWDDQERIPDTMATKPDDWDETAPRQVVDPSASMPNGWLENEPSTIPDPTAVQPEDWDDDTDGDWEAPQLDNPRCKDAPGCGPWTAPLIANTAYKGTWRAPLIDNPNYRGKWEPRKIPNPDYFEESHPYKLTPIGSVALELWSMVDGVVFDNFIITSDQSIGKQYADQLWYPKSVLEGKAISASSESVVDAIVNATKERPWLWAVYLVAILLPIIILVVFCMSRSSGKKTSNENKKKTDEPTSDDIEPDSTQQTSTRSQTSRDTMPDDEEEDENQEDIEIDERNIPTKVTTTTTTTATTTIRSKPTGKDALESEVVTNEDEEEENVESTDNKNASPSAANKARRRMRKE